MAKTKREVIFVELSKIQLKKIEKQLIETVKLDQNRFIFDKNEPNHSNNKLRSKWFEDFGNECVPNLPGKSAIFDLIF